NHASHIFRPPCRTFTESCNRHIVATAKIGPPPNSQRLRVQPSACSSRHKLKLEPSTIQTASVYENQYFLSPAHWFFCRTRFRLPFYRHLFIPGAGPPPTSRIGSKEEPAAAGQAPN